MPYDKEKDTYTPDFLDEIQEVVFEPIKIAWINEDTINSDISIET